MEIVVGMTIYMVKGDRIQKIKNKLCAMDKMINFFISVGFWECL